MTSSDQQVADLFVAELMGMGIDPSLASAAVQATGGASLEAALDWALGSGMAPAPTSPPPPSHPQSPLTNTATTTPPLAPSPPIAPIPPPSPDVHMRMFFFKNFLFFDIPHCKLLLFLSSFLLR